MEQSHSSLTEQRLAQSLVHRQPDFSGAAEMTVADVFEPFLLYCRVERQHAAETLEKTRECFRSWLLPRFGHHPVVDIRAFHLLSFRQAMADRNLSAARQMSLLITLRGLLGFCRSILEINCLDPSTIRLPPRKKPKVEYLTNSEIKALRETIDASRIMGLRMRALFELLLGTGMRITEALSLDRNQMENATEATIIGKGGKMRTVFFNDAVLHWIRRYLLLRKDNHAALFVTYGQNPERLSRGDIPRLMKRLSQYAGLQKKVTPHLLRHTFCTNLRNNGADISLIKDLAGHQNVQTTARYYLAADKEILRNAVHKYLNYNLASDQPPAHI